MTPEKKNLLALLFLIILHPIAKVAMAEWRIMEAMLAPATEGASALPMMLAMIFLMLRLTLFFIAPGLAAYLLWHAWIERRQKAA